MNVLVIPEDYRKDQYVLLPIVRAMMRGSGAPKPKVRICTDPLLGSVNEALKWARMQEIIDRHAWQTDLFLLLVDRDGVEGRRLQLDSLERYADGYRADRGFIAENAWQEIEVWVLAGHKLPSSWDWDVIRADRDPKDSYFTSFARRMNRHKELDGGRDSLATAAAVNYQRIQRRCPEVRDLESRIRDWINTTQ